MNQPEQIRGVDFQSRKAFKAFIQFSLRKAASKDEKFPSLEDLHVVWLLSEPTQILLHRTGIQYTVFTQMICGLT